MKKDLCKFSRSALLQSEILQTCPFDLTSTQAKECPCKRREFRPYGAIDLRVIECSYPKRWNGRPIENLTIERELLTRKSNQKVSDTMSESGGLWGGGIDIKVVGVCGEIWTGKTLFLQSIDPDNTLYRDWELSSGTYTLIHPDRRINVQDVLSKKKITKPIDRFRWWLDTTLSIPAGKYSVIADDTVGDVEQGLADYVASKHEDYGFRTKDSFEKTGGIFWAAVRAELQEILIKISQLCQTFAFASHMRDEWSGGKATGRREPQGKDTWMKLASAYFQLGRPVDSKGNKAEKPDGIVLKHRVSKEKRDADGKLVKDANGDPVIVSLLPPRLSPCTPGTIRNYIKNPPNYEKLKKSEVVPEVVLSDDDKLRIQSQIAADQARAAEAENKRLEQVKELKSQPESTRTEPVASVVSPPVEEPKAATNEASTEPTKAVEQAPFETTSAKAQEPTTAQASEAKMSGKPYTRSELIANINMLKNDLKIPEESWVKNLLKRGAPTLEELSDDGLEDVKSALWTKHTAWKMEQEKKR